jgi:hypothetical protein
VIGVPVRKINSLICCVFFFICLLVSPTAFSQEENTGDTTKEEYSTVEAESSAVSIKDEETDYDQFFQHAGGRSILTDSIQIRHVPDSIITDLKNDDDFAYANALIRRNEPKTPDANYTPLAERVWFRTLIWAIIIAAFAGVIIWYLAGSRVLVFGKKDKKIAADDTNETMPEDIFAINYQKEIDKAALAGNYRLAVRLMFLRLLKNLSERNLITYKQDRTNFDYLLQLHPTRYYKDFFRITRNYEYSWYGKFEMDETTYGVIKNDFNLFTQSFS